MSEQMSLGQGSRKEVYAISERNGRTFWSKVGAGFDNKDGSTTLLLDAMPVSGKLQVRTVSAEEWANRSSRTRPTAAQTVEHYAGVGATQ